MLQMTLMYTKPQHMYKEDLCPRPIDNKLTLPIK